MKRTVLTLFTIATLSAITARAGALYMEVGNPEANPEAKALRAAVVARVTACHDPAKSVVTASLVTSNGRTALTIVALKEAGTFAVVGSVPPGSIIDIAVTNPEYQNIQPHVLIRNETQGLQWATVRRFFGTPPTAGDYKSLLAAID